MSATTSVSQAHLVEELLEELNVDEHSTRVRELLSDDSEEDLGAERRLVWSSLAALRADRVLACLEESKSILQQKGMST